MRRLTQVVVELFAPQRGSLFGLAPLYYGRSFLVSRDGAQGLIKVFYFFLLTFLSVVFRILTIRWTGEFFDVVLHLLFIVCFVGHEQFSGVGIEWVLRIRVKQKLREKYLENVEQVVHRGPGLIYHVQADGARPLIIKIMLKTNLMMADALLLTSRQCSGGRSCC